MRDYDITFNKEQCKFEKGEIEFFGHIFTEDGLKPSPEKVKAIKECGIFKRKEKEAQLPWYDELPGQCYRQLCNHSSSPVLLNKERSEVSMGRRRGECLIKDCISKSETMAYFDPKKQTILRTEASFNEGLAAALLQKTDEGMKPVHFISRSMTETKKTIQSDGERHISHQMGEG